MTTYWTNFAKFGDPNGASLPLWSPFSSQNPRAMLLGDDIEQGLVPNQEELKRIDRVYSVAHYVLRNAQFLFVVAALTCFAVVATVVLALRRRRQRAT